MQDIVCAICGRRATLAPGATMACPSCGATISAPVATTSSEFLDDSATRPSIPPIPPIPPVSSIPPVTSPVTSAAQSIPEETTSAAEIVDPADTVDAVDPANTMRAGAVGDARAVGDDGENGDDAHVTKDAEATADYPLAPPPQRTQTVPAAALPSTEPSAPVKPPRKRGPVAVISVILLILLLIAVGVAGVLLANGRLPFFSATPAPTVAPTATLAPTATPQTALTLFTDADNVFHIGYPTGWLAQANNVPGAHPRLVIFANPPKQASFNVGTLPTTDTPAQGVVEQELAVLAQKTGIANRSGPTTLFIAGQTWTQEAGDVTVLQNGKPTPMHAIAMATIYGSHTVYILELAPVDSFATVEPFFQQMLQSFEFLG